MQRVGNVLRPSLINDHGPVGNILQPSSREDDTADGRDEGKAGMGKLWTARSICVAWTYSFGGEWSGVVVSTLASINEVNQRRARLVLRWVTVSGFNSQ